MATRIEKTEEEWRRDLTPEQYEVLRRKGTERAFTGAYVDEKSPGVYRCAGCGAELFRSEAKFDSGTGWPSFVEPTSLESVETDRPLVEVPLEAEVADAQADRAEERIGGDLTHRVPGRGRARSR